MIIVDVCALFALACFLATLARGSTAAVCYSGALFASWALSAVIMRTFDINPAPGLVVLFDIGFACVVASLLAKKFSVGGACLLGFVVLEIALHIIAAQTGLWTSAVYLWAVNGLYCLEAFAVGGPSLMGVISNLLRLEPWMKTSRARFVAAWTV